MDSLFCGDNCYEKIKGIVSMLGGGQLLFYIGLPGKNSVTFEEIIEGSKEASLAYGADI